VTVAGLYSPTIAYAQTTTGSIQIEPAFQEIVLLESQATASATIHITNTSQNPLEFELQPISIQQFDTNGTIILADKPVTGADASLASFITLPEKIVSVAAASSQVIPVQVTNSQSLGAGGHYAAIVARLTTTASSDQVVLPAVSSFILVRKQGGERYNLSIVGSPLQTSFFWTKLPSHLPLLFSNQGNAHVIPRGTIEVTDPFNRLVAKSIINENSLYVFPSTQREINQDLVGLKPILPISLLQLSLVGSTQPGSIQYQQSAWIIYLNPWGIGIIGLAVASIVFGWFYFKKHERRS
jgi:hypothetical protein